MAFLVLKSNNNPKLGYVISKNPNNIGSMRSIRKGVTIGWFPDPQTYCVYFKDDTDEISFKTYPDQEYEYLTITKFNYAYAYNTLLAEFFSDAFKKQSEHDSENFHYELELKFIKLKKPNTDLFIRYFPNIKFEISPIESAHNNFNVKISVDNGSLHELLNVAYLYTFMSSVWNHENVFVDEGLVSSYVTLMKRIAAPYFIRYVFKSYFLKTKSDLVKYIPQLNVNPPANEVYDIKPFDLHTQRIKFLLTESNLFSYTRPIIDLGCGEGTYTFSIAKKLDGNDQIVHAVDINTECTEFVARKAVNREVDNVVVYNNLSEVFEVVNEDMEVLCTEVIEHIEIKESQKLIKKVLSNPYVKMAVFTTPNKDFNTFYNFDDDETRHDDHKWEYGFDDFQSFINQLKMDSIFNIEFHHIGDVVNGITPTVAVSFIRK